MKAKNELLELRSEIEKTKKILDRNFAFYLDFKERFIEAQGKETAFAMTLLILFSCKKYKNL